ncbi:LAGLIDADG family homing endonuclease [Kribbella solani]|uniref:LAGLIDADG family homing endonuclease n=1 Tax=Kribbella solani TaxID=236067 RepID=UPI0029B940EB|nr:LAGLIDADG family homing endonuclease [Kribbella solani]MDX3006845.1 LAGLIDADG family homing endonuclease [Kribbella solani]
MSKKEKKPVDPSRRGKRPMPRGWPGPGGGYSTYLQAPAEWRGTTVQVCGMWPFGAGTGSPMVGVPIGRNILSGATMCCDPISWFMRAKLISNPSMFVLGKPGLGKALDVETLIPTPEGFRRMADLKPGDFVFDAEGSPTAVVAVSEVMTDRECWELTFSTGETIVADAEHLWVTETVADRRRAWVDRKLPRKRLPIGTADDVALVRSAAPRLGTDPVTVRDLTKLVGWSGTSRESSIYRWAAALDPVRSAGNRRWYEPASLVQAVDSALHRTLNDQRAKTPTGGPVTTAEVAATLVAGGKHNHAVRVMPGLRLPAAELPLDPYVLGAWLGDGHSAAARLTCNDAGIVERIRAAGIECEPNGRMAYRLTIPGTYRQKDGGLTSVLRNLGVLGDKHIPVKYLRASEQQRRELLAGLLDTDGTVSPAGGQVQYTATSRRLAEDVFELVAGLGYRPTMRPGTARLDGRDCGPMWTIGFTTSDQVFGLERKQVTHAERTVAGSPRTLHRYVVAARKVPTRSVRCIQVANPDGLYLVGRSFITTHNSTITRRMALGLAGYGVMPLVLGDLKPDYKDLIEALGGQVIQLGRGRGHLNVLDPGESREAALRLTGKAREAIQADAHGRRQTMVSALISIMRSQPPNDREETILDEALKVLDERFQGTPVLRDLLQVVQDAPDRVRNVALDRGSLDRYRQITEGLEASLIGLVGGGRLGEIFSEQTDNPMQMDRPVVFDVSNIDDSETNLQAAVLLACWSYGFGAVAVAQALADAGLEPRRHYFVILDELWRVLRAGRGLVDRVDALTRLNRQRGVGMAMISHTMSDLLALEAPEDRMKAKGFVERSGMVICGGLPRAEMDNLTEVVPMSQEEQNMLIGWQDPPAWDPATGQETAPPGRGNFLVKVGGRPGIPVHVGLTSVEREINDTNKLWTTGDDGKPLKVEVAPDGTEEVVGQYSLDDPALLPPPDPTTRLAARTGVDE